ncbi:MAG: pyridoxal-dependent decarboxylase [Steroidobacteraceae bacterium]
MTPEEFRAFGHQLVDWIADYRERAAAGSFPVLSQSPPGLLRSRLPRQPPQLAEDFREVLADLERLVLPACTHWQDPRFFAYFPSNGLPAAVLGDLASTGDRSASTGRPRAHRARSRSCSTGGGRCSASPSTGTA